MGRMLPVNAEFETAFARLGTPDQTAGLRHGIEAALAVTPGDVLNPTDYPILGFYFTSSPTQFLAYFVTPGRFVRYEVADSRSLTVTVPLDRITRVVEEAGTDDLSVLIELDADANIHTLEAETQPRSDGPGTFTRAVGRQTRTVYPLAATTTAPEAGDVLALATFSRSVRSAVGL